MAGKKTDVRAFLVQKGERVALAIAVMAMLAMTGMAAFRRLRVDPRANGKALEDLCKRASQAIQQSKPPSELAKLPTELTHADELLAAGPDWFPTPNRWFDKGPGNDRRWRLPRVLPPDEFTAHVLRGGVQAYDLLWNDAGKVDQVGVLQTEHGMTLQDQLAMAQQFTKYNKAAGPQLMLQMIQGARWGNRGPGGRGGWGGGGGSGRGGFRRGRGGSSSAGPESGGGGSTGSDSGGNTSTSGGSSGSPGGWGRFGRRWGRGGATFTSAGGGNGKELKFVSLEEFTKTQGAKLAQTVVPIRMAIIAGAFPFRRQLEEFRRALRLDNLAAVLNDPDARPEFLGLYVQRRRVDAAGAPIDDWTDVDIEGPMRRLRIEAVGLEPEDPELVRDGIIVRPNRLVMPRPKLAREVKYPSEDLPAIRDTVKAFQEARQTHVPPPAPKKSRFENEIDVWSDQPPPAQPATPAPAAAPATASQAVAKPILAPEHCLFRFLDVTIKPGETYEYRVRVRLANPTYHKEDRAISREITADKEIGRDAEWTLVTTQVQGHSVPLRVSVRDELRYYAVDEKPEPGELEAPANAERAAVQIHRWLESVQVDRRNRESEVPVGQWSILPRELAHRGEYVGKLVDTPVPVWDPARDGYVLASPPEEEGRLARLYQLRHPGVAVDFSEDPLAPDPGTQRGPVVVDFEGGKLHLPGDDPKAVEEAPVEILVLGADGRLVVHNSRADTADAERRTRYEQWKNWVHGVERLSTDRKPGDELFKGERRGRRGGP